MHKKLVIPFKAFVFIIIFIGVGCISITANLLNSYERITFFSLIMIISTVIVLKQLTKEIFSFAFLFLVFSYIIHLGHPFLISLGYDQVFGYDQRGYTTSYIYMKACQYCVKTLFWLMLGIILGALKTYGIYSPVNKRKKKENSIINEDCHKTYIVGLELFFLTLIPRIYVDLTKVILYFRGGYLSTYNININGYILVLAKLLDLAILIIMVGSRNNKHRAQMWMFGMCAYHCLFMMTGNRGDAVMRIIVMMFVYSKIFPVKKYSFYKIIGLFIVIWIGGAVLSALEALRLDGMTLNQFFIEVRENILNKPAILQIFSEFGVTIKTVCFSFESFPQLHPFSYGMNYLKGTLAFLPNINGFITNSIRDLVFVYFFQNASVIGGSYIGELYYAFGNWGSIFAIIIGYVVSSIDYMRICALFERNWKKFLISVVFITPFLWWIRDYYYTCVREIVMSVVFIYILYKIQIVFGK